MPIQSNRSDISSISSGQNGRSRKNYLGRLRLAIFAVVIVLLLVVIGDLMAKVGSTSKELQTTRNGYRFDLWHAADLSTKYFKHRREKGDWPPPGTYSSSSSLRFLDSKRNGKHRLDRYIPYAPAMILTVNLHDDGLITLSADNVKPDP